MEYLKYTLITFAVFTVCFFFAYLAGSFMNADFNLNTWDPFGRGFIGLVAVATSAVITAFIIENLQEKKKKD